MANRPTAIILGARFPALGVVSCLSQAGIACVVCESRRYQAAWSRRAVFRRMPDPRVDPDVAAARVTDIAREFTSGGNLPVVIPTDDHFAILLAQNADSLSKVATLCCGKSEAVTLFADQLRFASWAQEQDVNVPRSSSAKSFDKEMSFPIIVKPLNYSCFLGMDVELPQGTRHSDLRYNRFDDAESWS